MLPIPECRSAAESAFSGVDYVELPAVFHLNQRYSEDKSPDKVNLTIGAYRDETGKPWVLPVVKKAESMLAADDTLNKEYLSMGGLQSFTDAAMRLVLGDDNAVIQENRGVALQTLSGTGALYIAFQFIDQFYTGCKDILVSNPSWGNHKLMIDRIPGLNFVQYTYYDANTMKVDVDAMCKDLGNATEGSVVLLHACAHNPTGIDPSTHDWVKIADVCQRKKLFPLFDLAYLGYASGDFDEDAYSVRLFAELGLEFFVCQSFAKNMGLYCERVGNLTFVGKTSEIAHKCLSQMKIIVRSIYSNPPSHGARIASMCLTNKEMRTEWEGCVKEMHARIKRSRKYLHTALVTICNVPGSWDHILSQNGMFSYTGLTKAQCEVLIETHHVYLLKSGRISICGITENNAKYVAHAIKHAIETARGN